MMVTAFMPCRFFAQTCLLSVSPSLLVSRRCSHRHHHHRGVACVALVYISDAKRRCCPRTQDQDPTTAVSLLRCRGRAAH